MDLERSASSCGPEEGARGLASGMLARMAVAKTGNSFGRSYSAVERPSPLSESSGEQLRPYSYHPVKRTVSV